MKADVKDNLSLPDKNEQVLVSPTDARPRSASNPPAPELLTGEAFIWSAVTACATSKDYLMNARGLFVRWRRLIKSQ